MKLLIVTQAVDSQDPVLGFFVRWIEEFAKHCEGIEVICLRVGAHALPPHVRVHPLRSQKRTGRTLELWQLSTALSYDGVFVHMNPEYFVAAGIVWKAMKKRTALWYTHKSVDLRLRIATFFADVVFTASKESFRLHNKKVQVVGHGIDTDFFTPDPSIARGDWLLSVGRLTVSKRHDLAIEMAAREGVALRIAGEGPERRSLEELSRSLGANVRFLGPLTQEQVRDEYRRARALIHTSETGSLDKVVLEAVACGLPVRTNDAALKYLEHANPTDVRKSHSLGLLIGRIMEAYARKP
jgi:glycosyltransferase involved in cell wall biosynthesis